MAKGTLHLDPVLPPLAAEALDDPEAAAVYLDALLERPEAWRDERVMMLCLGVPLGVGAPAHLGEQGRKNWRRARGESIAFAQSQRELYVGRQDFARATVALVLFGSWAMRSTSGPSPWPLARRADPAYQATLARRRDRRAAREQFRLAREVRDNALRAVRRGA